MSMTYAQYVTRLATMTAYSETDTDFTTILPSCIDDAEGRCYRDLDMINLDVRDSSSSTVALDRNFNLPTSVGTFQIVTGVNIITPAATAPDSGTRNQLAPASLDVLDRIYPSTTGAGVPQFYSYISQSSISGQKNIVLGPWPDAAYRVEVVGKIQWTPLSSTNTTTFLSLYLPDLLLSASMIFMAGFQKNYGASADDPKSGLTWEAHYQTLLNGAGTWEARKRFAGASWSSKQLEPTAAPQRG